MIERYKKKLASWKSWYLSPAIRITLIKSVLESLPVYSLSCFKCSKSVAHWIEKIQRDFFAERCFNHKKDHLVQWAVVCKSVRSGGLGVWSVLEVNQALLRKWLWQIGESRSSLWKELCISKFNLSNGG